MCSVCVATIAHVATTADRAPIALATAGATYAGSAVRSEAVAPVADVVLGTLWSPVPNPVVLAMTASSWSWIFSLRFVSYRSEGRVSIPHRRGAPVGESLSMTSVSDRSPAPPRGRPRSSAADAAILDATRAMLAEEGWAALTIEGVAARAGVAKTTVYRRFSSRTDLAVAAVAQLVEAAMVPIDPDCTPEEQIRRSIHATADVYRIPAARAAYLAVLAEAGRDPELRAAVDTQVLGPARAMVVERLAMGVERGEIDPAMAETQADLLFDVLAGTLLHRMLVRGQDIDDEFVESLVCAILVSLGVGPVDG